MTAVARTPLGLRITGVVVVALLAIAAIAHGAWTLLDVAAKHSFERQAVYRGVQRLTVVDKVGDVRLTRAPAGSPVRVTTKVTEGLVTPDATVTRRGDSVKLSGSCATWAVQECHVDYTIAIPAGTHLLVSSPQGDVTVRDYRSHEPLRLHTSGGDVDIAGVVVPELDLDSSGGDIEAQGIRAPVVDAHSSAGDVQLELAQPARTLEATSSAGDVRLVVPDVPYRVKASSSAGDVSDSGINQDPKATRRIKASSSAGDVRIEPAG
jgi:Putative adhesin